MAKQLALHWSTLLDWSLITPPLTLLLAYGVQQAAEMWQNKKKRSYSPIKLITIEFLTKMYTAFQLSWTVYCHDEVCMCAMTSVTKLTESKRLDLEASFLQTYECWQKKFFAYQFSPKWPWSLSFTFRLNFGNILFCQYFINAAPDHPTAFDATQLNLTQLVVDSWSQSERVCRLLTDSWRQSSSIGPTRLIMTQSGLVGHNRGYF